MLFSPCHWLSGLGALSQVYIARYASGSVPGKLLAYICTSA